MLRVLRVLRTDYVLLALLALPAMLPLLLNSGLPTTADGVLHLYRTFELDRAWRDWVFYPRIAPDFAYGLGYPIFNYYAPLFYFLSQAFHLLGISLEWALKGAVLLTFYLYPLGMYLLARRWLPRAAALGAAVAYLYAPYRFYEAFIQGDYPQFLALAIVPFCLWGLTTSAETAEQGLPLSPASVISPKWRDKATPGEGSAPFWRRLESSAGAGELPAARAGRATSGLRNGGGLSFPFVAAYAALIVAHNITALITTPLIGAYIVFVLAHEALTRGVAAAWRRAVWTALGIALAVGLTAFFWLPALGEQRYVHIENLTSGGFFDFRKYFLSPTELLSPNIPPDLAGVNPYIPFNLGPAIVLLAAAGLVAGIGLRLLKNAGIGVTGLTTSAKTAEQGLPLSPASVILPKCRDTAAPEEGSAIRRTVASPRQHPYRRARYGVLAMTGELMRQIADLFQSSEVPGRGLLRAGVSLGVLGFWAVAAVALAAMTLPLSAPLWERVPLLVLTEFPWRFVGVAAIPLAMLAGCALSFVTGRAAQAVTALIIALIVLDSFVYLFPRTPFLVYGDPALSDLAKFELGSQALGTTSAAEYLPLWTQHRMYDSQLTPQLLRDAIPDHLYREALPVTVHVSPIAQTVDREAYRFQSVGPLSVRILRIYFPGWTASIDGVPVPLELDAPNATMRVQMPAGDHVVDFRFGETVLRQAADALSAVMLVLCAALAVWTVRRRPPASGSMDTADGQRPASGGMGVAEGQQPANSSASAAEGQRPPSDADVTDGQRTASGGADAAGGQRPLVVAGVCLILLYFAGPALGYIRYSRLPEITGMQQARADRFGDELRLLGYDLPPPLSARGGSATVRSGDALPLTLYWQPLRTIENDYSVFAHLDNPLTLETVAQTLNDRPGNISTVELPLSLYVRDPHVLRIPADVEPGLYLLRVGVLNPRTGAALTAAQPDGTQRTRVALQSVRVRSAAQPDMRGVHTIDARVGAVELMGYTLDAQNRLSLYWRAPQPPVPDATIFVHVLDGGSQTTATFDGPPAGGLLPLSAWERYEVVVDRRTITAVAGPLRLAIGMYDPQTQARLPAYAQDGHRLADDAVVLDSVIRNP